MKIVLNYIIEGITFKTAEQYITGAELKNQGGIPLSTELYLAVRKPFNHELIENDTRVNLARPDVEQFFVKKKLHYFINDKEYISYKQWISGAELRIVGNVSENENIYLLVDEGWQNDHILDDELVDLARPGKERFVTKVKPSCFIIYVNGREHKWNKEQITFNEVLSLYTTNVNCECTAYTVKYTRGPVENPEGSMVEGDIVFVKSKMNFNVATTNRS